METLIIEIVLGWYGLLGFLWLLWLLWRGWILWAPPNRRRAVRWRRTVGVPRRLLAVAVLLTLVMVMIGAHWS